MKRKKLLSLLLLFLLTACGQEPSCLDPMGTEHPTYTSSINKAECYLCGENPTSPLSAYWGQENVGLVNLNTFDIFPVPINTYGPDGQQVRKAQGTMNLSGTDLGEIHVTAFTDPDRGSSRVNIPPSSGINPKAIVSYLCQDCLNAFGKQFFLRDAPSEIAVVDFATRDLHPLIEACHGFGFDTFSLDCDFQEDGSIELLIYYSPPRFQEAEEIQDQLPPGDKCHNKR